MKFRCDCGTIVSTDAEPGSTMACPACGKTIKVPAGGTRGGQPGPPPAPHEAEGAGGALTVQCVCGKVLSMDAQPGAAVQCPACGRTIQVPGGPPGPPPFAPSGVPAVPPVYAAGAAARTSGLAIAALILGLASLIFGPLTGIAAIILGIVALGKVKASQGEMTGTGLAIAGLATGALLSVTFCITLSVALLLPALARARGAARTMQCSSNLRQINLALFQYENDNRAMPPADHNLCLLLAPYLGSPTFDGRGSPVWRCPSDHCIPEDQHDDWCSYAPNASVEETDEVIGTFSSSAQLRNSISSVAPDTITFIEMWTPPNVVEGHPGFLLKLDRSKPENVRRSMVVPGRELCAIRSYRTARPVEFDARGRLVDCGNYLFLRAFVGKKVEEMYHHGRINVGFIDGHVERMNIKDLIATDRPIDNPAWTREPD